MSKQLARRLARMEKLVGSPKATCLCSDIPDLLDDFKLNQFPVPPEFAHRKGYFVIDTKMKCKLCGRPVTVRTEHYVPIFRTDLTPEQINSVGLSFKN